MSKKRLLPVALLQWKFMIVVRWKLFEHFWPSPYVRVNSPSEYLKTKSGINLDGMAVFLFSKHQSEKCVARFLIWHVDHFWNISSEFDLKQKKVLCLTSDFVGQDFRSRWMCLLAFDRQLPCRNHKTATPSGKLSRCSHIQMIHSLSTQFPLFLEKPAKNKIKQKQNKKKKSCGGTFQQDKVRFLSLRFPCLWPTHSQWQKHSSTSSDKRRAVLQTCLQRCQVEFYAVLLHRQFAFVMFNKYVFCTGIFR